MNTIGAILFILFAVSAIYLTALQEMHKKSKAIPVGNISMQELLEILNNRLECPFVKKIVLDSKGNVEIQCTFDDHSTTIDDGNLYIDKTLWKFGKHREIEEAWYLQQYIRQIFGVEGSESTKKLAQKFRFYLNIFNAAQAIKYIFIVWIVIWVLLAVKGEKEEKSITAVTEDSIEVTDEGIGQITDEEARKSDDEKDKDVTDTEESSSQEETMPQESTETDPFARYETGTAEQEKLWSFTGTCEYGDYVKLKRYQNQFDNSNVKTKELLVTDILDGGEMIQACEYTTDRQGDPTPEYDAIYAITDQRENKDITILEGDKIKIYGTLYKSNDTYVHIDAKYIRNAAIDGNIQFERTTIPDAAYEAYVSNPEGLDLYDSAYLTKNVVNHLDLNAPVLICESEDDDRASIYQYGHLIGFSPRGYIRYYNFIPASEVPEADVTESIDPSTIAGTYSYEFGENEDACGAELTITGDDINNLSIEGNCWYGESCGEFHAKIGLLCHDRVVEFKDDNGCILEVYQTKRGGIYVTQIGEAGGYGATFYGEYQRGE